MNLYKLVTHSRGFYAIKRGGGCADIPICLMQLSC